MVASLVLSLGAMAQPGSVFNPFNGIPGNTLLQPLSPYGHDFHNVEVPNLSSVQGFPSVWYNDDQSLHMGLDHCVFYKLRLTEGEHLFRLKIGWMTGNWFPLGAHIAVLPIDADIQTTHPGPTYLQGGVGVQNLVQNHYVDIPETGWYWLVVDGFGQTLIRYNIYAEKL